MLYVYTSPDNKFVAMIAKPDRAADAYVPEEPWCLLHNNGRVDRFETQRAARDEALKSYGPVEFRRTEND